MNAFAYLGSAVLVVLIGVAIIAMRNRPRTTMESSIDHFQRGLQALAPERDTDTSRSLRPATEGGTGESD